MSSEGIPKDVQRLITEHINSVEQLETLLLLQRNPHTEWGATSVSRELYTSVESAAQRLSALHASGFLLLRDDAEPCYRYAARSAELDRTVRLLASLYIERRVSIISFIFSRPLDNIRSFADAFKLKKDEN